MQSWWWRTERLAPCRKGWVSVTQAEVQTKRVWNRHWVCCRSGFGKHVAWSQRTNKRLGADCGPRCNLGVEVSRRGREVGGCAEQGALPAAATRISTADSGRPPAPPSPSPRWGRGEELRPAPGTPQSPETGEHSLKLGNSLKWETNTALKGSHRRSPCPVLPSSLLITAGGTAYGDCN